MSERFCHTAFRIRNPILLRSFFNTTMHSGLKFRILQRTFRQESFPGIRQRSVIYFAVTAMQRLRVLQEHYVPFGNELIPNAMILVLIRAMTIQRSDITKRYFLMALAATIYLREHGGGQRLLSVVQAFNNINIAPPPKRFCLTSVCRFRRRNIIVSP